METKKDSLFLSNILKQKPDKKSETFFVSNLIFVFVRSVFELVKEQPKK